MGVLGRWRAGRQWVCWVDGELVGSGCVGLRAGRQWVCWVESW